MAVGVIYWVYFNLEPFKMSSLSFVDYKSRYTCGSGYTFENVIHQSRAEPTSITKIDLGGLIVSGLAILFMYIKLKQKTKTYVSVKYNGFNLIF